MPSKGWSKRLTIRWSACDKRRNRCPPDDRLLIVTVTEEDLETLAEFPLTDGTVAQAIDQLQEHDPVAIGIDMFRAVPKAPGREALLRSLQADNVVVITQLSNTTGGPGIPPPPDIDPAQVSFNDVVVDADGKVRRALLIAEPVTLTETPFLFSFSLQLAMRYLATQDIVPEASPQNPDYMQLGDTTLWPLQAGSGGYAGADDDGYQIMLDYRDRLTPAREVTLQAVLNDQVDPEWIRGKVVLMGITAPSFKDLFYTPFTAGASDETHQMPGVVIHAQMVSQLLDIAVGDRPPDGAEPSLAGVAVVPGLGVAGGHPGLVFAPSRHPGCQRNRRLYRDRDRQLWPVFNPGLDPRRCPHPGGFGH